VPRVARQAARVIVLDEDDRLLMLRGHDPDEPGRSWWFTVGGGLEPGEDHRQAAVREVREETGFVLPSDALTGPVLTRDAVFDFARARVRQEEQIFLARLGPGVAAVPHAWTQEESDMLDELRWFTLDELAQVTQEVYPVGIVDLTRGLLAGWDGVTRHLDETGQSLVGSNDDGVAP
jgi:8-oxo-dGTP pyrophosphatase MutT (NUDIX family)